MTRLTALTVGALATALLTVGRPVFAQAQGGWQIMDLGAAGKSAQNGGTSADKQSQQIKQQKTKECTQKANDKHLRGNDRQKFMRDCLSED